MKKLLSIFIYLIIIPFFFTACEEPEEPEDPVDTCVNSENTHSFQVMGKSYELVREKKTWKQAANCAVEKGGYLAEINTKEEQNGIYAAILGNIPDPSKTVASDGGDGSYVWLGATDVATEGTWIWDGNSDGTGEQFWSGTAAGASVNDAYENWGDEPDNFNDQDAMAIGITNWPRGVAGEWNDVGTFNSLYFVVEFD